MLNVPVRNRIARVAANLERWRRMPAEIPEARLEVNVLTAELAAFEADIDVRLPGCTLARLRDEAAALKLGGVGYYVKSGFVHVDIGRVRYW